MEKKAEVKMDISNAMFSLVPNASWSVKNGVLRWQDESVTQPTDAEIDAEVIRLQAEYDATQYQRDRQYPSIGDQLDTLFHDMTAGKGTKDGEWYKAIEQVKADNPKPE